VIASCVFSIGVRSCGVVLKEDFSNISARSNSPETLLQGVSRSELKV
jgi:hypothetical protein